MNRFYPGNVIRTKNNMLEIVYSVDSTGYTSTVFVDIENGSAGHRDKTYTKKEYCDCGMLDCEYCREGKPFIRIIYGMEDAVLVAHTVKEWITKSLAKGFDFEDKDIV